MYDCKVFILKLKTSYFMRNIYVWIHLPINININYITENHYNICVIPIKSMIISCPEKIVIYYATIVSILNT